ncbi:helix-turn-helix domain-containing protein [Glycomyces arizonensis]|uniref:helix-turn-helix domain-containing protein n=1 Tax=Glycomyces arizonensis TaxID=256035 RepID=UPI001B7FE306|nr:XRE family transcriptional regulator [Glycomyces arizonensis]
MVLDFAALGRRIADARKRSGLTQDGLSAAVTGLDRTAIAKIETGGRRVTALELADIAEALNVRLEWFLTDGPPSIVAYRNMSEPGQASAPLDAAIECRVREVEFVADHDRQFRDSLVELPSFAVPRDLDAAERLGGKARALLKVGQAEPLYDLHERLAGAGVVPFVVESGLDAADAASASLQSGAVVVVNGSLKVGRRRLALAHELGHLLVADGYTVDRQVDALQSDHKERAMDRFARALLLPKAALRERWLTWGGGEPDSLREAAVRTASHFRVDMATLARRLLDIGLLDGESAEFVRETRTGKADFYEYNLLSKDEFASGDLPKEYVTAVLRLFKAEIVSEARALDLLFGTWEAADLPEPSCTARHFLETAH